MNSNLPIHVAFCVNDAYSDNIRASVKGLLENNKSEKLTIHILSDYISDKNKARLLELVQPYSFAKLEIRIVDDSILRGLKDTWTIYTWYRVLLPEILAIDIHRVLYLDADIVVSGSIAELFSLDMTDKAIAGTIDAQSQNPETYIRCGYPASLQYVCAGIMLMNLDYWREHDTANKVIKWGRDNNDRIKFPDQDAINYICCESKILLPLKYDIVNGFFCDDYYYEKYSAELLECIEHPAIIHYAGRAPWVIEKSNHLLQDYWEKYNNMLPLPVKRYYESKGMLLLKIWVYDLFHSKKKDRQLRLQEVRNKLTKTK